MRASSKRICSANTYMIMASPAGFFISLNDLIGLIIQNSPLSLKNGQMFLIFDYSQAHS